MKRSDLISELKKAGVYVCGTTEDFGNGPGGIWVSMEEGLLANYPMSYSTAAIDDFHKSEVNGLLESNGWFLEQYDGGTAMIWQN
jgi:hypothetical protein